MNEIYRQGMKRFICDHESMVVKAFDLDVERDSGVSITATNVLPGKHVVIYRVPLGKHLVVFDPIVTGPCVVGLARLRRMTAIIEYSTTLGMKYYPAAWSVDTSGPIVTGLSENDAVGVVVSARSLIKEVHIRLVWVPDPTF